MYISPSELKKRLEGQTNLELKKREGLGRKHTIPHETKVLIGALAKVDTQANVAREFGTSQANVSYISRGLDSKNINEELKKDIEATPIAKTNNDKVSNKAVDILMQSLGVVESKVGSSKSAAEASLVAKNMASIVGRFTPRIDSPTSFAPKIQINIHGSKQRDESDYESIEVEPVQA